MEQFPYFIMNFEVHRGYSFTQIRIGNTEQFVLLDTGSRWTMIDSDVYYETGGKQGALIDRDIRKTYPFDGAEFGGVTLCDLTIAETKFRLPICLVKNLRDRFTIFKDLNDRPVGILGNDFFEKYGIVINYDNKLFYSFAVKEK